MLDKRISGILLPVAALPGKDIGNFGEVAFRFLEQCEKSGQKIWQILPLGPTIVHDSPFYSPSAFAIGQNYIDLYDLSNNPEHKFLEEKEIEDYYRKFEHEDSNRINYGLIWEQKMPLLTKAFHRFLDKGGLSITGFKQFLTEQSSWIEDYASFMGIKEAHMGDVARETWFQWNEEFKNKKTFDGKMAEFRRISELNKGQRDVSQWNWTSFAGWNIEKINLYKKIEDKANFHRFLQWLALEQWRKLKNVANSKGIRIIGDCPIYVAPDSADVWANREVFKLDASGSLTCYAGVPPDYFSPKYGQFWGNPIYRWFLDKDNRTLNPQAMSWWTNRLRHQLELCDELRIDHFRGFAGYWEIPCDNCETKDETGMVIKTAKNGQWLPGPGKRLFDHISQAMKTKVESLPIVAEDLGVITKEVNELRHYLHAPGMGIFQFAPWGEVYRKDSDGSMRRLHTMQECKQNGLSLDSDESWEELMYCVDTDTHEFRRFFQHEFLPNSSQDTGKFVFYPGTHDNETLVGWFENPERKEMERDMFLRYLDFSLRKIYEKDPQLNSYLKDAVQWKVIHVLSASQGIRYTIFQMQDILGLPI